MSNPSLASARAAERGAASVKTVLTLVLVVAVAFAVIKITPVYIEERGVLHDVDELARISAVRNLKEEEIKKGIEKIRETYGLAEGSITLVAHEQNKASVVVKYSKKVDFLVTTYDWQVDYTVVGRAL